MEYQKKPLVLIGQESSHIFPRTVACCNIRNIYTRNSKCYRVLRKLIHKTGMISLEKQLFRNWSAFVEAAPFIVVFDTGNAPYIVRYINKMFPDKRVILWYWNSIKDSIPIEMFQDLNVEIWSFDPADCKKYNLKYNTQFYFKENYSDLVNEGEAKGVFYVGADKDREKFLIPLKKVFDENSINYNFNLVKYKDSVSKVIPYKQPLSYKEVITNVKNSYCVIDLVAEWQSGLTLRPLEALVLKKKLITNMKNISSYSLYNKNNIFIIGQDDFTKLKRFVLSEYDETNWDKKCEIYSSSKWIERFTDMSTKEGFF